MSAPNPTSRAPTIAEGHELADRYVLRRRLAEGGMAQVWLAEDTVLDRNVAVKMLHPHLAGDGEFVERFRREARAAARLSHQSIVAIYDTATADGIEAIVMELIDGMTLRQYLDSYGKLSLDDAVDLVTQVADALDAAHAARIVHRDIKPGNIMLCPDRRVKVTDFGIAKALEDGDRTSQGTLLGTAKYLAPEQVEGTDIDGRADVYSLGVVLYEALTGAPPFQAGTDSATALARLRVDPRPPRELRPDLPPAIDHVLLTALARDREHRYGEAGALAAALAAAVAAPVPSPAAGDDAAIDVTRNDDPSAVSASDPTLVAARNPSRAEASPLTPSTDRGDTDDSAPPAPRTPPRSIGPVVVGIVVIACLVLGLGLILATTAGRDFFGRAGDRLSGEEEPSQQGDNDTAGQPASAPANQADDQPDSEGLSVTPTPAEVPSPRGDGFAISAVHDFDPLGDGRERPERVGRAVDGDESTVWASERYSNRELGNLKAGVGLVIVLEQERTLDTLTVTSTTSGWAAQVYVGDSVREDLEAWGDPIDGRVDVQGNATFDLRGVRASTVLLWVTDLGTSAPRPRIEIAELAVS